MRIVTDLKSLKQAMNAITETYSDGDLKQDFELILEIEHGRAYLEGTNEALGFTVRSRIGGTVELSGEEVIRFQGRSMHLALKKLRKNDEIKLYEMNDALVLDTGKGVPAQFGITGREKATCEKLDWYLKVNRLSLHHLLQDLNSLTSKTFQESTSHVILFSWKNKVYGKSTNLMQFTLGILTSDQTSRKEETMAIPSAMVTKVVRSLHRHKEENINLSASETHFAFEGETFSFVIPKSQELKSLSINPIRRMVHDMADVEEKTFLKTIWQDVLGTQEALVRKADKEKTATKEELRDMERIFLDTETLELSTEEKEGSLVLPLKELSKVLKQKTTNVTIKWNEQIVVLSDRDDHSEIYTLFPLLTEQAL